MPAAKEETLRACSIKVATTVSAKGTREKELDIGRRKEVNRVDADESTLQLRNFLSLNEDMIRVFGISGFGGNRFKGIVLKLPQ